MRSRYLYDKAPQVNLIISQVYELQFNVSCVFLYFSVFVFLYYFFCILFLYYLYFVYLYFLFLYFSVFSNIVFFWMNSWPILIYSKNESQLCPINYI